ncbi:MAG: carboxypeptidase regulatory-like domain-containing protein, partial [Candidatus Eremiobacteraeota bacterium]|nr:carboxypeptidase regulatory-like domain-containing protein [Candidatus Eremiobacteraeota bacterium]
MKRRFFAGVFAMALAAPGIAHAGTTGRITGTVRSTGGAPIAGATVTISSPSQTSAAQTDARGSFAFISVPPDTYSVTVTKSGFEPVSGIAVVQADQTIALLPVLRESLKTI